MKPQHREAHVSVERLLL